MKGKGGDRKEGEKRKGDEMETKRSRKKGEEKILRGTRCTG